MPTRRTVLEEQLVAERVHLWADLERALRDEFDVQGDVISGLVGRIRSISSALGFVTLWRNVPPSMLRWYQMVETVPSEHLTAQWADFDAEGIDRWGQVPVSRDARDAYGLCERPSRWRWFDDGD